MYDFCLYFQFFSSNFYPIVLPLKFLMKQYSQVRAMLAITRGSLRAIFRSPSAVIFSFVFPLIFILVFGFIGGGGITVRVAITNLADTNNVLIKNGLLKNPSIRLVTDLSQEKARSEVGKGNIAAILEIDSLLFLSRC